MKLQDLIALGVPEEQAKQVVAMHDSELKDAYVPLHRFNEVNGELVTAKSTIKTLQSTSGDVTKLTAKIETLETELNTTKENHAKELEGIKRKGLLESALNGGKHVPHDLEMVLSLLDQDKIKIKDDNTLEGLTEQLDALVQSKSFLFKEVSNEGNESNKSLSGWLPFGNEPKEGEGSNPPQDDFGKSLAQARTGGTATSYDYFK